MTTTYTNIYDENEGKYRVINDKVFETFLTEFSIESDIDVDDIVERYHVKRKDYTNLFWMLHSYLFNFRPELIPLFYGLLERYHYHLGSDYVSLIRLAGLNISFDLMQNVKDFLLKAPYIEEVSSNQGEITIHSAQLGTITFYPTQRYFQENVLVHYLLTNFPNACECHNMSWKLTKAIKSSRLVTSLLPMPFEGTCYHSTVRMENGFVVDVANGIVVPEDNYHQIFQNEIICETDRVDLEQNLGRTSLMEGRNFSSSLVLALHEQKKRL